MGWGRRLGGREKLDRRDLVLGRDIRVKIGHEAGE